MSKLPFAAPLLVALLALGAACAPGRTPGEAPADQGPRRASDHITHAEIQLTSFADALEVVRRLRPRWLTGRGPDRINNPTQVVVYLDNVRVGGPEALGDIPAGTIRSMQFVDAGTATTRWGTGHASGAIVVLTQ